MQTLSAVEITKTHYRQRINTELPSLTVGLHVACVSNGGGGHPGTESEIIHNRQQIENMSGHAIAVYIIIPCVQEIVKGFASLLTSLNQEPGSFSRMY